MGKLRNLSQKERLEAQVMGKKSLYEEIASVHVYKHFRDNLRPWDRQLPPIVEQEANRRQLWIIKPPSGGLIMFMMFLCIAIYQVIGMLPVYINWTHVKLSWRDTDKPSIIYNNPKVLMACWLVTHICTGFALWFIWLAEGFSKHALELFPMLIFSMAECTWCDILFYTHRLDWVMACWCFIMFFVVVTQILLLYKKVAIAALFLLPHVAACLTIIVYLDGFMDLFPDMIWYSYERG